MSSTLDLTTCESYNSSTAWWEFIQNWSVWWFKSWTCCVTCVGYLCLLWGQICWLVPGAGCILHLKSASAALQTAGDADWPQLICGDQISHMPALYFCTSSHLRRARLQGQAVHGIWLCLMLSDSVLHWYYWCTSSIRPAADTLRTVYMLLLTFLFVREMFNAQNADFTSTTREF